MKWSQESEALDNFEYSSQFTPSAGESIFLDNERETITAAARSLSSPERPAIGRRPTFSARKKRKSKSADRFACGVSPHRGAGQFLAKTSRKASRA